MYYGIRMTLTIKNEDWDNYNNGYNSNMMLNIRIHIKNGMEMIIDKNKYEYEN